MEDELDIKSLKYVLYARKSTDDPIRQVRSIDDQIKECEGFARRLGIHIKETIIEKKSAKKPGLRPLFRQMLNDLKLEKYDGIIAWNPDRLARNMKEGGEIIDMIDDNLIKDMKFVTHHFSKDANGKMLLGMAFVLSKQYSDNLSQNVTRGVRRNLLEGRSPIPKHGYIKDSNGLYALDETSHKLIRQAWDMRLQGTSLEEIARLLKESGYTRETSTGKKIFLSKQTLSDMFKDPFYYGILVQTNQKVDLRELYDFQPILSESEYIDVQRLTDSRIKPYKSKKRASYLPLKMMIVCSYCGNHMYPGASKGNTKRYLFYRCDGKFCTRKEKGIKKNIRAKVIFEFIYKFLDEGLNLTEKEYEQYYGKMVAITARNQEQLQIDIHSKEAIINKTRSEIKDIGFKLLGETNKIVKEVNEDRLSEKSTTLEKLLSEVQKLKEKVKDPNIERITIEQFLNLSKNAVNTIKMGDAVVKDTICRLIFLNFTLEDQKVLSYQLKPPFDELLKRRSVNFSRGQRT